MLDCVPGLEVGATLHGPVEHGVEGHGGPLRGWTALYFDQLGCLLKLITMIKNFLTFHGAVDHGFGGGGGPFMYKSALHIDQFGCLL